MLCCDSVCGTEVVDADITGSEMNRREQKGWWGPGGAGRGEGLAYVNLSAHPLAEYIYMYFGNDINLVSVSLLPCSNSSGSENCS